MGESFYYFAYGANMSSEIFQVRRGLTPISSEPAMLDGWRLVFEQPGVRFVEPVFATLTKSDCSCVEGVLYRLDSEDVDRLNRTEGAGYEMAKVTVKGVRTGATEAFTYLSKSRIRGCKPSRTYLAKLVHGAREHGLSPTCIKYLQGIDTVHIPGISFLMDRIGWLAIRFTASGGRLNNLFLKFGATIRPDD